MTRRFIPSLFIGTVFLGAMLGFQIQPLVSSVILPWFGGGSAVWTVCLMFFQSTLFLGYYYTFRLIRSFSVGLQLFIHIGLLSAVLLTPVLPAPSWKPQSDENPELRILLLLACHTGLSFLVLSSTGPLLQVWFLRVFPGKSPYRLYAYSNAGSFLGLVTVPFILEIWLSLDQQATLWYVCFTAFSVMTIFCGVAALGGTKSNLKDTRIVHDPNVVFGPAQRRSQILVRKKRLWFFLAMTPVLVLAAITGKLTTDVSPVPFLWIGPLAIYLLSLIVCFTKESLSARQFWVPFGGLLLLASSVLTCLQNNSWAFAPLQFQFALHLFTLIAICMICHGDLVRLKPVVVEERGPTDQQLTEFYLVMALGGAAGGAFAAIIAPLIFPDFFEYHLGLLLSAALPLMVLRHEAGPASANSFRRKITITGLAGILLLALLLLFDVVTTLRNSTLVTRSFFGVSRVLARRGPGSQAPYAFELMHGTTIHGFQFVSPQLMRYPTTYYGPTSGVGIALHSHHESRLRRIGVIGLGVGTLAAYGRPGDVYDFYEIDPVVRDLASQFFRYLRTSQAAITVIPGDGRLSLERRRLGEPYDLLVLDAFSSDAVPVHLLTAEAFEVYGQHLAGDGIIAVHISNHHFDLRPVLLGHAQQRNWSAICIEDITFDAARMTLPTFWVLLSPEKQSLETTAIARAKMAPMTNVIHWTDASHSLFRILGSPSF